MSFILRSNIGQVTASIERRAEALVARTTFGIQAHARQSMAEAKHGRPYRRGKRTHIASAPGESPAADTGFLTNSIQAEVDGLHGRVGTNAEYAMVLEFGGTKMAARPFMAPAFEDAKPSFEKGLKELAK